MRRWLCAALVAATGLGVAGCPKKTDKIVAAGEGKGLTDADIDRDPLALLPSGAVGLVAADAQKLFESPFGQKLLGIAKARSPLPPSAGFEPARDIERVALAFYSMQGADVAAVVTGRFDKAAIERAADGTQTTPLGTPLVKSSYAGRTLYTSLNVGFVVLTSRTALAGNETGIRRALDRIKEGRAKKAVPKWFQELLDTPNAPIAVGFDLRSNPLTDSARERLPFVNGLQTARMVGNFQPPGVNVAGTGTYTDAEAAQRGAATLVQFKDLIASWGWLASILRIPQPVRQLEAKAQDKDVKFVAALDAEGIGQLIDQLGGFLGVPTQPSVIPANVGPGVSGDPGVPK